MKGRRNRIRRALLAALQACGRVHSIPSRPAGACASRGRARAAGILRGESGQALILTAICMTGIMGAMAAAIDVGNLHWTQVKLQNAAEGAAMAGALEVGSCGGVSSSSSSCTQMQNAATSAVNENGLGTPTLFKQCATASGSGVLLTLNNGPCALSGDPNSGSKNYVEAVVQENVPSFFGSILGHSTVLVVARSEAVATVTGGSSGSGCGATCCVWAGSLVLNGNSSAQLNCGIYDNGSIGVDSGANITASPIQYHGSVAYDNCNGANGFTGKGSQCTWGSASPTADGTAISDPLAGNTEPTQPSDSPTITGTPNNGQTLQPGYYPNGFNLNSGVSVTLSPGVYYMGGSINVGSGATLSGTGVTLYFASGNFQPNSNSTVSLTAPTSNTAGCSCDNANIVIWEQGTTSGTQAQNTAPNTSSMTIDSGSSTSLNGVIYLPDASLTLNSMSVTASTGYTLFDVGGQMTIDANDSFSITENYPSSGNPLNPSSTGTTTANLAE